MKKLRRMKAIHCPTSRAVEKIINMNNIQKEDIVSIIKTERNNYVIFAYIDNDLILKYPEL